VTEPAARRLELCAILPGQLESIRQLTHSVLVGQAADAPLQVADAACAQLRPFGQLFLRQAGRRPVLLQQDPKL
jgi:hypothetical protein